MARGLGGKLARFLGEKLDDPRSREAARRALRKVTGEESSRHHMREGEEATHGNYIAGLGAIEVGDRAGFELRDRVAEALKLYRHDAELLDGALRQALARYDRRTLGEPDGRYPDARRPQGPGRHGRPGALRACESASPDQRGRDAEVFPS